jgi:NADPH:quinone reductase-like Zn-dependent oxidoreductase
MTTHSIGMAALLMTSLLPGDPSRMRAIVHHEYGSPDVLRLEAVEKPVPTDDQLLIRVRAASVNPLEWHNLRGTPYLMRLETGLRRPKSARLGVDFSGTVEAVGRNVTGFKPGDEVFGGKSGALAEYVCVTPRAVLAKPANLTFEQAAAVPIAAVTALQGLRDHGKLRAGEKVLVNGASGGVGTFAVQIAKVLGAEVTGVCSTRNVDLVRSLGADRVVDYTRENFTEGTERYDLILDMVGNHDLLDLRHVLKPDGRYVMVGGPSGRWTRPMDRALRAMILSRFVSQEMGMCLANLNPEDLATLRDLMAAGKVTPVIDREFRLSEVPEAIRYLETGRARGKVVIVVEGDDGATVDPPPAEGRMAGIVGDVVAPVAVVALLIGGPIVAALALNRRFRRNHPGKRPYRWGYFFAILMLVRTAVVGMLLEIGLPAWIACVAVSGVLSWFFARRRRWAWIALTILSFNPVLWVLQGIYLRKRWREDAVRA